MQKIWIGKAIVSFQTPEFSKVKRYKYFYAKNFESAKRLKIVSNPRIFKGEAIQVEVYQSRFFCVGGGEVSGLKNFILA
jgi:hypothetical protein